MISNSCLDVYNRLVKMPKVLLQTDTVEDGCGPDSYA